MQGIFFTSGSRTILYITVTALSIVHLTFVIESIRLKYSSMFQRKQDEASVSVSVQSKTKPILCWIGLIFVDFGQD